MKAVYLFSTFSESAHMKFFIEQNSSYAYVNLLPELEPSVISVNLCNINSCSVLEVLGVESDHPKSNKSCRSYHDLSRMSLFTFVC
jgi:hypothetical protein